MSKRYTTEESEGLLIFVEILGNASDEIGRVVYNYIKWEVQNVTGATLVGEYSSFNADECREIKKRLLKGPLDCSFTDGDECKLMSMTEFLSVFRCRRPIPKDLPQYRYG